MSSRRLFYRHDIDDGGTAIAATDAVEPVGHEWRRVK